MFQKIRLGLRDLLGAEPGVVFRTVDELERMVRSENLDVFVVSRRKKSGFYGFPNNFVEKELGVSATSRNWSTVSRIVQLIKDESKGSRRDL